MEINSLLPFILSWFIPLAKVIERKQIPFIELYVKR